MLVHYYNKGGGWVERKTWALTLTFLSIAQLNGGIIYILFHFWGNAWTLLVHFITIHAHTTEIVRDPFSLSLVVTSAGLARNDISGSLCHNSFSHNSVTSKFSSRLLVNIKRCTFCGSEDKTGWWHSDCGCGCGCDCDFDCVCGG